MGRIDRANAATLSIRVSVITKKTRSRWFRKDKVEEIEVMRTLNIAAEGAGSVVTVSDESGKVTEDDAASRLLGIVRDRFGGSLEASLVRSLKYGSVCLARQINLWERL